MKLTITVAANQDGMEYPLIESYLRGKCYPQNVLMEKMSVRVGGMMGTVVKKDCREGEGWFIVKDTIHGYEHKFYFEHIRLAFV